MKVAVASAGKRAPGEENARSQQQPEPGEGRRAAHLGSDGVALLQPPLRRGAPRAASDARARIANLAGLFPFPA